MTNKWIRWSLRNPIRAVMYWWMYMQAGMALADALTVCHIGFNWKTDYHGFKKKIHEMVCWEIEDARYFEQEKAKES